MPIRLMWLILLLGWLLMIRGAWALAGDVLWVVAR